ncbi:rad-50, partial [Pristionchus pacificus]
VFQSLGKSSFVQPPFAAAMALFEEMIIQGIRAYPPTTQSVIKFVHPLTIIQGNNGCGKTTIIEALNNICTGALPQGQKQAFLHDLENAKTVKVDALIKLRFRDVRNREIVACTRMTNLVGKEGKNQTKADEQTIKVYPHGGERGIAISSKTIDFRAEQDEQLPIEGIQCTVYCGQKAKIRFEKRMLNLLGIPKSILENVVFCHQENSTWPLSEPAKLKERFDAIFQLTGFVKFVEKGKSRLKELRETYMLACAEHDGALAIQNEKQIAQTRLETKQLELQQAGDRQREVAKEMNDLTKSMREAAQQLQQLRDAAHQRNVVLARLDGLRKQREMLNVPEWSGSEKELREMIKEMESSTEYRSASMQKAQLEKKLKEFDNEAEQVKVEKRKAEQEVTRVSAMEMHRNSTAAALHELTVSIANEFGLRADVKMLPQLEALGEGLRSEGEGRVHALAAAESELRAALESASNARLSLQIEHKSLMESMNKLKAESSQIERRLSAISSSQNEVPELRNQIATLERMLTEKVEPAPSEEQQRAMEKSKKKLIDQIAALRESIRKAGAWEETGRNRQRMEKEKESEERARNALLSKHETDFMLLFARVIRDDPINAKITQVYAAAQEALANQRQLVQNAEISLDRARMAVRTKGEERDSLMHEKMELQEKIVQVTGDSEIDPDDVEWRHDQTMAAVQSYRKELAPLEASATLYAKWADETKEKKCCPVCERTFGRDNEGVSKLARKLADLSFSIPKESAELAARLEEEEQDERKLAQAKNYAEQMRTATRKWTEAKAEVKTAEKEVDGCSTRLAKDRADLELMAKRAEAVVRIKADASLMDSHLSAIEKLTEKLQQGEREWIKVGAPAVQQKQEEEDRLQKAESDLDELNSRLDEAQKAAAEVNRITREMNELRDRILRLDEDVVQRASIEERLQKCYEELRTGDERLAVIAREGPKRDQEVEFARDQLQSAERATRAAESEVAAAVNKIAERRDRLTRLADELEGLARNMGDLAAGRATLSHCDERLDQLRTRKAEIEHEVTKVGEAQDKRRVLTDQLMLIENTRSMAANEKELKELSGSEEQKVEMERKYDRMEQKKSDLLRSQGELDGQLKAVKDEVDEIRARLSSGGMRAADEKFIKALAKKMAYGHAVDDLQQYIDAVDKSMLDFHKEKMTKINRIVDELWRSCYNGGDIETIRIMSEQTTVSEGKKNQYNYRVMMALASGAEVDMRDRCSAGQKMLACLIIRLALADTFGQNCATIALDEPTTNLDKDKVDAMAEMLGELISVRSSKDHLESGGRGIQMIVITHDRRFVDKLCLHVKPEYRYEVTKSGSEAYSNIQRVYTNGHTEHAGPSQVLEQDEREWMSTGRRGRGAAATRAAPAKRAPAARKRKGHQEEEEDEVEWD